MARSFIRIRFFAACLGLCLLGALQAPCADPVYVRFNTVEGNIDVELLTNDAPITVANFLSYADSTAYNGSFIHRSEPGFIFQGGGYYIQGNIINAILPNAPIINEFKVSNTRGTLAMAKSPTGPNTATNQWFFNEVDNSANLDNQNGGYTVFGVVANPASLTVMDQISNLPIANPPLFAPPSDLDELPLFNYTPGNQITAQNFVTVNSITRLTQPFVTWQSIYFSSQPPSISGPTAIPENDRVPNLLKYLYDIIPNQPMSATDRAALPIFAMPTIGGTKYLTLTYRQYAFKTGVTVNVQTSPDAKTWTTLTNPSITQMGTDSHTYDPIMQVQVAASGTKEFIRLNVTMP